MRDIQFDQARWASTDERLAYLAGVIEVKSDAMEIAAEADEEIELYEGMKEGVAIRIADIEASIACYEKHLGAIATFGTDAAGLDAKLKEALARVAELEAKLSTAAETCNCHAIEGDGHLSGCPHWEPCQACNGYGGEKMQSGNWLTCHACNGRNPRTTLKENDNGGY